MLNIKTKELKEKTTKRFEHLVINLVFWLSAVECKAQVDAKMKKVVWGPSCEVMYHWSLMIPSQASTFLLISNAGMHQNPMTPQNVCLVLHINIINPSYFREGQQGFLLVIARHVLQRVESCWCKVLTA